MANDMVPYVAPQKKDTETRDAMIVISLLLVMLITLVLVMFLASRPVYAADRQHDDKIYEDNTYGGEKGKPDATDWEDVGGEFYEPKKKPYDDSSTGGGDYRTDAEKLLHPMNAVMSRGADGKWWSCTPLMVPQQRRTYRQ